MSRSPDPLACIGLAALLALSGCASTLKLDTARPLSHAVSRHANTPLKAQLAKRVPPDESGFHLLHGGHAALAARLALAQRATRTIDVQSYLFHNDITGKLVAPGGNCVADVWWSPDLVSWTRAHDVNDATGSSQVLGLPPG